MERVFSKSTNILALGAESAGIFAVYKSDSAVKLRSIRAGFLRDVSSPLNALCRNRNKDGNIFISENFGDLLDDTNFLRYKKAVLNYLKKEKFKPGAILTDLHPLYKTTIFGEELVGRYKIPHIKIQHHIAHIFSAVGDSFCHPELVSGSKNYRFRNEFGMTEKGKIIMPTDFFGIAMDGTGYGLDGNIWGGEVFEISNDKFTLLNPPTGGAKQFNRVKMTNQIQNPKSKKEIPKNNLYVKRIGSLEEQMMIGGDLAVREPARMLVAILAKRKTKNEKLKTKIKNSKLVKDKNDIYKYVKKFYTRNEFEALYNQMEQDFNCQATTSTGRVLDAVSVLLGFAGNERKYKHEAVKLLEKNSTVPYNIEPSVIASEAKQSPNSKTGTEIASSPCWSPRNDNNKRMILQTTPLFEYLIKNIHKDKRRLAATAQLYIAKGLYELTKQSAISRKPLAMFAAGGLSNNKIISEYLEKQGIYLAKKISRGDEGIAVGQIVYYLLN